MKTFHDRVILITGAGSGIGRELARQLLPHGGRIGALDRSEAALASLTSELGSDALATAINDVTDPAMIQTAVAQIEERLGPIDMLIASAGLGFATPAHDFKTEDFKSIIDVNLIGVANSIAAVLPGMRQRKRGHLVALSSLASYRGLPHMAGYSASKAGVNALMDSLRFELKPYNIHVTTICPGWIKTPMTDEVNVPQPEMMDLPYAVGKMVKAISRRKHYYLFPRRAAFLLRLLRWLPSSWSDRLLARRFRQITEQTTQ